MLGELLDFLLKLGFGLAQTGELPLESGVLIPQPTELVRQRALVTASLLASGAVNVNHGLGRVPQGWIVVGIDAQATVWSSGSTNKTLTLLTSADAGVTLWVF